MTVTGFSCSLNSNKSSDGGVFKSTDKGASWEQKGFIELVKNKNVTINKHNIRQLKFDPSDPSIIYAATNANGLYRTDNAAEQWKKTGLSTGQITSIDVDPVDTGIIYATSGRYLYKSTDSGNNWEIKYTESRASGKLYNVVVDPYDSTKIYLSNDIGGLFKSYDSSSSWQQIKFFDEPVRFIRLLPSDTRKMYAVIEDEGLFYSETGGKEWKHLEDGLKTFKKSGRNIHSLDFDPTEPSTVYMATDYGLLKSTDAGNSWEAIRTLVGFNTQPLYKIVVNKKNHKEMYYTTNRLIYRSNDGGFNWEALTSINSSRNISQLLIHPENDEILYTSTLTVSN